MGISAGLAARPRVSVLLLCWNHQRYLDHCIGGLARQTDREFEILFLDNASSDGSSERAAALFEQHGLHATMLRNEVPASIPVNLNRLLEGARGELIAPLSTDDWYAEDYVAAVRATAEAQSDAGWFACGGWLYFEDTGERRPIPDEQHTGGMILPQLLAGTDPFNFVGCCYRRTALEAAGGWDERMLVEDRDLFVRLAGRFPLFIIPERLVTYRRSSAAASADPKFMVQAFRLFFDKHRALFGRRYRNQLARMLAANASVAIDQGQFGLAWQLLSEAVRLRPQLISAWRGLSYLLRAKATAWLRR
ncbi:glycosyltransferase family 2 protein [Sphingomonas sp. BN140010]|uniref:Glycosyltransferase family 2 protein n=1 Tax=Sphingomonas arvum TaxID=2992113 RepID=A0ABT3JEL3_9SPHN|nr:glycosyltransferase family 2 protein [Sphingomonas sp. BN140010]MCW3797512.1 glycosyltransferase family 2 protein [Sphingomonas sp. BN140010]